MIEDELYNPGEEEFKVDKTLNKKSIKEEMKISRMLININEIQNLIDCFELNNHFSNDYNYKEILNINNCHYLENLFKAKILELNIIIIKNYLEVNQFNFNFDKLKKSRKIMDKLLKVYNCSQEKAVKKIKELIAWSGIEEREV